MKIRTSLMALALVMGLASASQAADLVRKVDSFDLVADQSGSMMMKMEGVKMTKAAGAKQVLTAVVEALPDLGYKASAHTVAPAGTGRFTVRVTPHSGRTILPFPSGRRGV